MLLSPLQNIGLSVNEGKIYEILVKTGEIPVSLLIEESQLKRPTVYKILYSLKKKGLVLLRENRKIIHARPEAPQNLLKLAQTQEEAIKNTKSALYSVLPGLNSLYISSTEKPVVKTYEGVEGLKEIYLDLIKEGKPLDALLQTGEVEEELFEWLTTVFVKKRKKAKVHAKVIVAEGQWAKEYKKRDIEEFRTSVIVSAKSFPFQHEVDIYGDKVAFIHNKKGEALIGIIIHHPGIAKTCRAWFNLAWAGAIS